MGVAIYLAAVILGLFIDLLSIIIIIYYLGLKDGQNTV